MSDEGAPVAAAAPTAQTSEVETKDTPTTTTVTDTKMDDSAAAAPVEETKSDEPKAAAQEAKQENNDAKAADGNTCPGPPLFTSSSTYNTSSTVPQFQANICTN